MENGKKIGNSLAALEIPLALVISTNALPPEEEPKKKKRAVGATVGGPSALFLQGLETAAGAWTRGRWADGQMERGMGSLWADAGWRRV